MKVDEYAKSLREMAEFLDERVEGELYGGHEVNLWVDNAEEMLATARKIGGRWEKQTLGKWYVLRRSFGPHHIDINGPHEAICERVQVGTETVEVPDPDAPKVTVEQPVYEWRCPESLNEVA